MVREGVRLPVIGAARANALMSDAAASDDSDLRNIVHAGTPANRDRAGGGRGDGCKRERHLSRYRRRLRSGGTDRGIHHAEVRLSRSSRLHGCSIRADHRGLPVSMA